MRDCVKYLFYARDGIVLWLRENGKMRLVIVLWLRENGKMRLVINDLNYKDG